MTTDPSTSAEQSAQHAAADENAEAITAAENRQRELQAFKAKYDATHTITEACPTTGLVRLRFPVLDAAQRLAYAAQRGYQQTPEDRQLMGQFILAVKGAYEDGPVSARAVCATLRSVSMRGHLEPLQVQQLESAEAYLGRQLDNLDRQHPWDRSQRSLVRPGYGEGWVSVDRNGDVVPDNDPRMVRREYRPYHGLNSNMNSGAGASAGDSMHPIHDKSTPSRRVRSETTEQSAPTPAWPIESSESGA